MGTKQDRRAFLKMSATYGTGLVIGCFSLSGCANSTKLNTTTKKEKKMNEMIAYCGLTCHSCPILLATMEKDDKNKFNMRVEIAKQIKERYGQECKSEDVGDCDGCKTEGGRLFSGCRKCQIRKCASQKKVETCAHCDKYICKKLEKVFTIEPLIKERLCAIKNNIELGE